MSIPVDKSQAESFASRWSRRKRGAPEVVEQEPEADPVPLNTIINDGSTGRMQTMTETERRAIEARSADPEALPALTDDDMPDVEELDDASDYSGFLSPGVSEKLRKVALRKLFAGAGFNIRDGLDDYDDDFTNFEPLGDIITSDMKHRAEMEAAKKEREEQERLAAELDQELHSEDETLESPPELEDTSAESDQIAAEDEADDEADDEAGDKPGDDTVETPVDPATGHA